MITKKEAIEIVKAEGELIKYNTSQLEIEGTRWLLEYYPYTKDSTRNLRVFDVDRVNGKKGFWHIYHTWYWKNVPSNKKKEILTLLEDNYKNGYVKHVMDALEIFGGIRAGYKSLAFQVRRNEIIAIECLEGANETGLRVYTWMVGQSVEEKYWSEIPSELKRQIGEMCKTLLRENCTNYSDPEDDDRDEV